MPEEDTSSNEPSRKVKWCQDALDKCGEGESKMKLGEFELNKIYCMDCLEGLKKIPDNSVDLVLTDPPYSTPTITSFGRKKVLNLGDLSIQENFFRQIKVEFERILKPNGRVFIFCDDKYYPILFAVFYDWQNKNLVIWDKGKIGMGNPFRKQHELLFYLNRETYSYKRTEGITHYPTILKYKSDKNKIHGAQKPFELCKDLIIGFSEKEEIVLDPFIGSGTTAVACKQLGRNFIGFEISPEYCKIANKRLEQDTLF
jgi:site-specific DNA-methyltransferase (adenine-specific)